MTSAEMLCSEVDRLLTEHEIPFVVMDGCRGFEYRDFSVSVSAGVEGRDGSVVIGAAAVCDVEADGELERERIRQELSHFDEDDPRLLVRFTEPNQIIWVCRAIHADDFTDDEFFRVLDSVTSRAMALVPELVARLGTGVSGAGRQFAGLEPPTRRDSRSSRRGWDHTFVLLLNHLIGAPVGGAMSAIGEPPAEDESDEVDQAAAAEGS